MKKRIHTLILMLALPVFSFAQTAEFTELETPASPGFILLDKTPSAIERPTTPQGFGIGMLNLFQGGAMEVAPFWLKTHPDLTAKMMFDNHFPVLHNLSLSIASVNLDSGRYITFGTRTRALQLYSKKQIEGRDKKQAEIIEALSTLPLDLEKIDKLRSEYVNLVAKPVFSVDVAGAFAANADSATVETLDYARGAAWLALNWRPGGDDFYVTGLGRYTNNVKFEGYADNSTLLDFGARFNYDIEEFTISAEYLQRMVSTGESQNRYAVVGSYRVNENLYFTGTFGKNFPEVKNLITLIGVNFGISESATRAF